MRYAGQRFRSPRQANPKFRAQRGGAESGRAPYANPTGVGAMQNMPDKRAENMAFTEMPDMSNPPFNAGNFSNPEFRAPSRIS